MASLGILNAKRLKLGEDLLFGNVNLIEFELITGQHLVNFIVKFLRVSIVELRVGGIK